MGWKGKKVPDQAAVTGRSQGGGVHRKYLLFAHREADISCPACFSSLERKEQTSSHGKHAGEKTHTLKQ